MNKRFRCRTHEGGIFSMPARRGRPPVKCPPEHPCDRADQQAGIKEFVPANDKAALARARQKIAARAPESVPEPRTGANDSLPLAMTAKARLEPLEWVVKGRAWFEDTDHMAEIVCSRGAETLIVRWTNGVLTTQDYQMESIRLAENGIPPHRLSFDPEEVTDSELARLISGMRVTWWNSLAGSTETATVGSKVNIEHIFVGGGDTDNSKRIVKFVEHGGGGFRAFHAGSLLKVG